MMSLILPLFWLLHSYLMQQSSPAAGGADYRYYQSDVRELPVGPKSPAYAVCDMLETFTGVPTRLDAEALRAQEHEHSGTGAMSTFYQYLLERKGVVPIDDRLDSLHESLYTHYICPPGSVLSLADPGKINAPNKIVSLLNSGIKGVVVSYDYCPRDWKKGIWKLGDKKGRHRPKGMHTVLIVGQQDSSFIFKNSWGKGWGDSGYGLMTFDYHRKHAHEGLIAYLADAQQPDTALVADMAIKLLPETLEGVPHLQVSIVAVGPGRLPKLTELSYLLEDGEAVPMPRKVLISETAAGVGYPVMLKLRDKTTPFKLRITYTVQGQVPVQVTFPELHWENTQVTIRPN